MQFVSLARLASSCRAPSCAFRALSISTGNKKSGSGAPKKKKGNKPNGTKPKSGGGGGPNKSKGSFDKRPGKVEQRPQGSADPAQLHKTLFQMCKVRLDKDSVEFQQAELKKMTHPDRVVDEIVAQITIDSAVDNDDDDDEYGASGASDDDDLPAARINAANEDLSVEQIVVQYICSMTGLRSDGGGSIDRALGDIARAYKLHRLSREQLERIFDGADHPAMDSAIEAAEAKLGQYIEDDRRADDSRDAATATDGDHEDNEDTAIVRDILKEVSGLANVSPENDALDADVARLAGQFQLPTFDERDPKWIAAVATLRERYANLPGALDDEELARVEARQALMDQVFEQADVPMESDDAIDAMTDFAEPKVESALRAAGYDRSRIGPDVVAQIALQLRDAFAGDEAAAKRVLTSSGREQ